MRRLPAEMLLALSIVCVLDCRPSQADLRVFLGCEYKDKEPCAPFYRDDAGYTPWYRAYRAGNPQCVSPWACHTYGPDYCGYYVGGGAPFRGEGRCPPEGTWGLDYAPPWSRVHLNWWHGRRYQGGTGQYDAEARNRPFKNGKP